MKTYLGIPGTGDVPAAVSVVGDGSRKLEGDFGWGKGNPKGRALAQAILADHLGDAARAVPYVSRFMWRTVATWNPATPFQLTGEQIDAMMVEMRETDTLAMRAKMMVGQEQAPVANEAGIGPGGTPFSPIKQKG